MRFEPPAGGRPAHTRTQPPFHFCPGVYYARLVEELRPLTYGLVAHKTKLMPKDQWSTILGHSPDVADALIQSMLLTPCMEALRIPRKGRVKAGASQVGVRGFCSALLCSDSP